MFTKLIYISLPTNSLDISNYCLTIETLSHAFYKFYHLSPQNTKPNKKQTIIISPISKKTLTFIWRVGLCFFNCLVELPCPIYIKQIILQPVYAFVTITLKQIAACLLKTHPTKCLFMLLTRKTFYGMSFISHLVKLIGKRSIRFLTHSPIVLLAIEKMDETH